MGWIHRIGWRITAAALLIAVLTARLAWIAGHAQIGWQIIADDCHAAVIGQFFGYRLPLPVRGLSEQSDYWVREINRVLTRKPHSPELLEGALLVLNSPCWDYSGLGGPKYFGMPGADLSRAIQWNGGPEMPDSTERRELQRKLIAEMTAAFAQTPSVWRILAALPGPTSARLERLKVCQSHDPDNALYDYLAAELDFPAGGWSHWSDFALQKFSAEALAALNAETEKWNQATDAGLKDIEAGLSKSVLEYPQRQQPITALLDQTNLPESDKAWIAANLIDKFRSPQLVLPWLRLQGVAMDREYEQRGRVLRLLKPFSLTMLEHGLETSLPMNGGAGDLALISFLATEMKMFLLNEPVWLPEAQQDTSINRRIKEFDTKYRNAFWATEDACAKRIQNRSGANRWIDFVPREAIQLAMILLLGAGAAYFVSRFAQGRLASQSDINPIAFGALPQLLAWSTALLVTASIFGLSPGGVITQPVQSYFLTTIFLALLTLLPLGVASWWQGRYSLRVLMELVFVYAVIFAGLVYWNLTTGAMKKFPPDVEVVPHNAGMMSADRIHNAIKAKDGSLAWSAMQWVLYDGPVWTIALALLIIGWWTLDRAKRARTQSGDLEATPKIRLYWLAGVVSGSVARAAAAATVVALAVFLALEPERIGHFEAIYLADYQQVHDPEAYWGGLKQEQEKLINEMRADVEELLGTARSVEGNSR
jgi:hypothetical protein